MTSVTFESPFTTKFKTLKPGQYFVFVDEAQCFSCPSLFLKVADPDSAIWISPNDGTPCTPNPNREVYVVDVEIRVKGK